MKIFISYSSQDVAYARRIAAQLRQEDFLVLRDQEFIEGGQPFNVRIQQVLRGSDVVLLLLTKASSKSHWVNEEIIEAIEQKKRVIPLKLESDAEAIPGTKSFQWLDFTDENQWTITYPRLVDELRGYRATLSKSRAVKSVPSLEETQEIAFVGNPFVAGPRVKPGLFTGRQKQIKMIVQHIAAAELQSRSIVANRRMGKTSLLTYLHKAYAKLLPASYARWAAVYIDLQEVGVQTAAGFMRAVRLSLQRDLPEEMHELLWKDTRDGHLQSFQESIKEIRKQGAAIILLLDEWEEVQAHTDLNTTVDSLRSLVNHGNLSLITSSAIELSRLHHVTELFMANAGKNPADTSKLYPLLPTTYLGLMPKEEWQYVVTSAFERCQRDIRTSDLRLIESLAGGNPILTQMAGSVLWESLDEGWNESEMRQIFAERADQTFRDWWNKEYVDGQQEALRHVLGLPFAHDPAPSANELNNAIAQLKLRGLLDDQGSIFAQPFADFINRLHR